MIRQAVKKDFPIPEISETAVRINALFYAYGTDTAFLHFYTDEQGSTLSVMDNVGILATGGKNCEEWTVFLGMHPDVQTVRCDKSTAEKLKETYGGVVTFGTVMQLAENSAEFDPNVTSDVRSDDVYTFLTQNFPGKMPPFDGWYVDISHRVRHGLCHLAAIKDDEKIVSFASSVAETPTAAILGQVATDADHRRQGLAKKCVDSLIFTLQGKRLYICPKNENAENLYLKCGFTSAGTWAQWQR